MQPTLGPGDRLFVRYGAAPSPGDIALVRLGDGTIAVKRLTALSAGVATAESDNAGEPAAWSGVVALDDVLAVVLLRVWPRPGRPARREAPSR